MTDISLALGYASQGGIHPGLHPVGRKRADGVARVGIVGRRLSQRLIREPPESSASSAFGQAAASASALRSLRLRAFGSR